MEGYRCDACFGASMGDCEECLHTHSTSQICEKCNDGSMYEPYKKDDDNKDINDNNASCNAGSVR